MKNEKPSIGKVINNCTTELLRKIRPKPIFNLANEDRFKR